VCYGQVTSPFVQQATRHYVKGLMSSRQHHDRCTTPCSARHHYVPQLSAVMRNNTGAPIVGIHPITTVLVINQRELRDRRKCSAYVRGARTPRTLYSIRAHVESLTHVTSYVRSLTSVLSTVCQGWQVSCVRIASDRTHM
jgi:hypothetical protein